MPTNKPLRLLVVATHPIQYHVPLFRALSALTEVELRVAFIDLPDQTRQGVGFGVAFAWDVPILEGYRWFKLDSIVESETGGSRFLGRRVPRVVRQLAAQSPDAVLVMGWNQFGLLQAWWAARRLGIPLIVRGESNEKRRRPAWKRFLHRILLSVPAAFVAIGRSNSFFYRNSGIPDARVALGPYFVDNEFFGEGAARVDRAATRAQWAISPDDCCLLFAGKFESKKRPLDLLEAVHALPPALRSKTHVLLVGAGPLDMALRAQADRLGIRVTFAGFLNQTMIAAAYVAADALVLPSDYGETWGLVVNEAMACGLPAVVADQVGCADDLVVDGETGWVFPTGDVPALTAKLAQVVGDPGERVRRAQLAHQRVTTEYTVARSAQAIVETVYRVVGESRSSAIGR